MNDFTKIPTSREVWAVIHARHGSQLEVFSSFSDPFGTFNGGAGEVGRMETGYGLKGTDFPLLWAETTWRIEPESSVRHDEKSAYWLCVGQQGEA